MRSRIVRRQGGAAVSPGSALLLAIGFLLLLTIVVYGNALLPGQTFLPADLLLLTPPWNAHAQELSPGFYSVQRPAWDPLFQFYPARLFLASTLKSGHLPLWNPHAFSGTPFAADDQSAVFYPPNWIFAVIPLANAFAWVAALHTFLAGLFFLLYGQRMGWGLAGSLCGATVWMLCGVMVSWQMWQVVDAAVCWLPLALYFWEGWRQAGDIRALIGMSVAIGMSLLAGHLQFAFYVWLLVGTYAVFRSFQDRSASRLLVLLGALALGAGFAAIQVLPTADLLGRSLRSSSNYRDLLATALPIGQIVSLFAPALFGSQKTLLTHPYIGAFNYYELTVFCGASSVFFGALSFVGRAAASTRWYWVGVCVFALALGCGTPLYALFFWFVPLFKSFHGVGRVFVLFDFAVAALCAQGVSQWSSASNIDRRKAVRNILVAELIVLLVGYRLAVTAGSRAVGQVLTHDWLGYGIEQLLLAMMFVVAAALTALFAKRWFAIFALIVVVLEMLVFAVGVNLSQPAQLLYPKTAETSFVSDHIGQGRILCLGDGNPAHAQSRLVPNSAMAMGWNDVSGSNPLFLASYANFVASLNTSQAGSSQPAGLGVVAQFGSPVLDELNVQFVVGPVVPTGPYLTSQVTGDLSVAHNDGALGQAWLAESWKCVPDRQTALIEALDRPKQSTGHFTVILDRNAAIPQPSATSSPGQILGVVDPSPGRESIAINAAAPGMLIMSQIADPGWKILVDKAHSPQFTADSLLLATPVPQGRHTVSIAYLPEAQILGGYLTCIAWGVAIGLLLARSRRFSGKHSS